LQLPPQLCAEPGRHTVYLFLTVLSPEKHFLFGPADCTKCFAPEGPDPFMAPVRQSLKLCKVSFEILFIKVNTIKEGRVV